MSPTDFGFGLQFNRAVEMRRRSLTHLSSRVSSGGGLGNWTDNKIQDRCGWPSSAIVGPETALGHFRYST